MRDTRRLQSRSEAHTDRVRVIWLTLGGLVALGLTFALGVVVGRRAERLEPAGQETLAEIDEAGERHEKLTFYDELTKAKTRQANRPVATPELKRTSSEQPRSAVDSPTPEPSEEPRSAVASPTPEPSDETDIRAALAAGPAKPGDFTVQVSAFQSLAEARTFATKLDRAGFKPFIVRSQITGKGMWFRVRLGRFKTEEAARSAKQILAGADIPAWVLVTE